MATKNEMRSTLTLAEARRLLAYNRKTGVLRWRSRTSNRIKVGDPAGHLHTGSDGKSYWVISIHGVRYYSHRVIWFTVTGEWPEHEIDHENGDGTDNRWKNLRCATSTENMRNQRRRSSSKSGATGVCWGRRECRWRAYIKVNKKQKYLGVFIEKSDAIVARKKAEAEYGYHPNHGSDRPL